MQTAYELVSLSAARMSDHTAVVDDATGRRLSYRELVAEVDAVAAGLSDHGVVAGSRVATVLPNCLEHVIVLLALVRLNAVPALVNPRLKPAEVAEIVRAGRMRAAVTTADHALVSAVRNCLPPDVSVITTGDAGGNTVPFDDCRGSAMLPAYEPPSPDDLAFIFYTSGTTGLPKGVLTPHRATEPRVLFMSTQCGLRFGAHNRVIGLMPLFHNIGFYAGLLTALAFNGTYYVVSAFEPARAIDLIEREGITCIFASPTHFELLLEADNFEPGRVASVQNVVYAGAPMRGPTLDRLAGSFPCQVCQIYGTTETMNSLYMPDPVGRPHTVRPGFYSRVRVARLDSTPDDLTEPGERGEILVDASADATFLGYLDDPAMTAKKLVDGWCRTGDAGYVDASGDIVLVGRIDDMIISGGENIHPDEIECLLTEEPGVREVTVVGIPDDRWGEIVAAAVRADDGVSARSLDAACRRSALADFKRPRTYVFVDALPHNAANKVNRPEVRRLVLERSHHPGPRDSRIGS